MKRLLALVLTLCTLLSVSIVPTFAEDAAAQTTISDAYKWDFSGESNGGKHCVIQRHSGYVYHDQNGCDCGGSDEVTHFAPFSLISYANGYHGKDKTNEIDDTYKKMIQDNSAWNFKTEIAYGDGVSPSVSAADTLTFYPLSYVDLGVSFVAPVKGTVQFDFVLAQNTASQASILVGLKKDMRETCGDTGDWQGDWITDSLLYEFPVATSSTTNSISISVEAGDEVVFLAHANMKDGQSVNFYFTTVEYTHISQDIPDAYKWDFSGESNGGKHCVIQRHSGYVYHDQNGCDCGGSDEVTHFAPFSLISYANGYHGKDKTNEIDDTYKKMIQDNSAWNFKTEIAYGDGVSPSVSAADTLTFYPLSYVDLGVSFVAPVKGTVQFDFVLAQNTASQASILVGLKKDMRETCGDTGDWQGDWITDSLLYEFPVATSSTTNSISISVEAGDEVVFLAHANMKDGQSVNFYFTTVEYTSIPTTSGIKVVGAQDKNDGTTYNTRFIATVDDYTKYDEIGFKIVADYGNGNVRTYDKHCTEVFDSLLAMEGNNVVQKTALDFNGKYLVTMTVEGIPMDVAGTATFTVQAYYVQGDSVTYTDAVVFNTVNGVLVQN